MTRPDHSFGFGGRRFVRISGAVPGTSLLQIPFAITSAILVALAITLTIDGLESSGHIVYPGWLAVGNIDDARAILGAMLGAVSTVLALIFSVTLLVFSMAVSQFGPRLMPYFLRERAMQVALGLFLGAFLHILMTFIVAGQRGGVIFHPKLTVLTGVVLVFVCFCYLVVYNHRIAFTMQTNNMLARIVEDLHSKIDELSQFTGANTRSTIDPPLTKRSSLPFHAEENIESLYRRCMTEGGTVTAVTSGYVQRIHHSQIIRIADRFDAFVRLSFRPGEFVMEGEELASVLPASATNALETAIQHAVTVGQHRTLEEDVEFAFAQLSEIAIRALSPAINDTYTSLSSIDYLGDALRMFAVLPVSDGLMLSSNGKARLLIPPLLFARAVRAAFDLIRQAAINNPAVCVRLLQTCGRLAAQLHDNEQRKAIREHVDAVYEVVKCMPDVGLDRHALEQAYRLACDRLAV